jgi:hypothetical protein
MAARTAPRARCRCMTRCGCSPSARWSPPLPGGQQGTDQRDHPQPPVELPDHRLHLLTAARIDNRSSVTVDFHPAERL